MRRREVQILEDEDGDQEDDEKDGAGMVIVNRAATAIYLPFLPSLNATLSPFAI